MTLFRPISRQFAAAAILLLCCAPAAAIDINSATSTRNSRFVSGFPSGPFVSNSSSAFIGANYNWSSVGWDGNATNRGFTLIDPRQVVVANHYQPSQLDPIGFASNSGNLVTVTEQSIQNLGAASTDVATATFGAPLSSAANVSIAPVLFLGYNTSSYSNLNLLVYGPGPSIGWNQLNVIETGAQFNISSSDPSYYFDYMASPSLPDRTILQNGDSGSPTFGVTGSPDNLYLVGTHYGVFSDNSGSVDTFLPMDLPILNADTIPAGYLPSVVTPTTARWTGTASGTWTSGGNWSTGAAPNDAFNSSAQVTTCASVLFDGLAGSQHAVTLSSSCSVTSLAFALTPSTSGGFTFGGSTLVLGEAGLTNNDVHAQTFNNAVVLRASQQWQTGAGGVIISASGSLSLGTSQLLYLDGSGTSDFEGVVSGGSSGIAKDGSGTLILGNSGNRFSGQIFVHNGTLRFGSIQNVGGGDSALGAPTTTANGTIYLAGTLAYVGSGSTSNRMIDVADGPGAVGATTGVIDASGAGALALTGGVICESDSNLFTGTSTLVLQGSGSGSQSGVISSAGTSNIMSLVKTGSGTWSLSASNTYTGTTAVSGGLLAISGSGGIAQSAALTVSGGTMQLDDSTLSNSFSSSRLGTQAASLRSGQLNINLGNTSGGTETLGPVAATAGENTFALTAGTGSGMVSASTLSRTAGATLNFTGPLGSSDRLSFSGMPSGSSFISAGAFVNGGNYAVYDAGGYVRAMVTGTNAWDYATTVTASRDVLLTSPFATSGSWSLLTLNLSGSNTGFTLSPGQSLALTLGGILKSGGGSATIAGGAAVSTSGEFVIRTDTAADQLAINMPITGATGLTKSGLGTLLLGSAGNSYAGTLKTTVANALPAASTLLVASGAALDLGGQNQTVAGITLNDGAILSSATAAVLTLGGSAAGVSYTGVGAGSSISGGTLDLTSNGSSPANHVFAIARGQGSVDLNVLAGVADGSAAGQSLVKSGSGILQLSGADTYTGSTQLQAGTLVLGSSAAIPTASSVTISGGTLNLGGYAATAAALTMQAGQISGSGIISAASFNLQSGTIAGSLGGSGSLSKTTGGTVTITASNGYTGGTTLSGGVLAVSADNNLGAASAALTLDGGTLQVQGTSFTSTSRLVYSTSNGGAIDVADPNDILTLPSHNLNGSGPLIKFGQGTLQFSDTNSLTNISLLDGVLQLTGSGPQLTAAPNISLTNVAALNFSGHNETVSTLNFSGGSIATGSGILILTGSVNSAQSIWPSTISGNLVLGMSAGTFQVALGAGSMTVAAAISGTPAGGLVKTGSGLLVLNGPNSYTGGTTIDGGTLQVGNGSSTATLGGGPVNNLATLTFDRTSTYVLGSAISGSGGLNQIGSTLLVLTGSNTYTGPTAITGGTLQVGNGGTVGTLGTGPVNDATAIAFNRTDNTTYGGSVSGIGNLVQVGPGTLVLTASNTYTGSTDIRGGVLQVNLVSNFGLSASSNLMLDGGVLQSSGTLSRSPGTGLGQVQWTANGGGFSAFGGPLDVTLGSGTLAWGSNINGTLIFGSTAANAETDFFNSINLSGSNRTINITAGTGGDRTVMEKSIVNSSGTAGLIETGNGLLVLAASNTYNGATTISGGTLQIGNGAAAGSVAGPIVDNAVLVLDRSGTFGLGNAISGSGAVAVASGAYDLTGSNSYAGTTTISGGTLQVGNGGTAGTLGGGPVVDNSWLVFARSGSLTLAGAISGSGGLIESGPGITVLTTSDSYSGPTDIDGGALRAVLGSGLPAASPVTLAGGVLESSGSFTRSVSSSGTNTVQWTAAGGGFSANGGKLTVDLFGDGRTLTWSGSSGGLAGPLMFGSATANNETDFINAINLDGVNQTIEVTAGQGGDFTKMIGALSNTTGTAGLIKTGNGLLVLAANNSYNGNTTITAGTLSVGAVANLGTGGLVFGGSGAGVLEVSGSTAFSATMPITLNQDGTIQQDDSATVRLGGAISGSGMLIKDSPGLLVLSGVNTYSGGTTVTNGTLEFLDAESIPGGSLSIGSNLAVFLAGPDSQAVSLAAASSDNLSSAGNLGGSNLASSLLPVGSSSTDLSRASSPSLSPVPEPSTVFLLLVAGGLGLGWRAWRGKRSART